MRTRVVLFLAASILLGAANANASGWRDLRIDAGSDARFNDSIQQMRDELPYHRAVVFATRAGPEMSGVHVYGGQ